MSASSLQSTGSSHKIFTEASQEIVANLVKEMTIAQQKQMDLTWLFEGIVQRIGEARRDVALDARAVDWKDFGHRRDNPVVSPTIATWLDGKSYEATGKKVLSRIVDAIKIDSNGLKFEPQKEIESKALDHSTIIRFEVMSLEDVKRRLWITSMANKKLLDPTFLKMTKAKYPEKYEQYQWQCFLDDLERPFKIWTKQTGHQKTHLVVVNVFLKIGKEPKEIPLSHYATWTTDKVSDDLSVRLKDKDFPSLVSVLHQDPFLCQEMLANMAKVFAKAMSWNSAKQNENNLKNQVGLLHYQWSHAMPFVRGSAAAGEWLAEALFKYHGFEVEGVKGVDLLAHEQPDLKKFLDQYQGRVKLTRLESTKPAEASVSATPFLKLEEKQILN